MPVLNFTQDGKVVIPLPVPIENGGTGAEDAATARNNLGINLSNFLDTSSNQSAGGNKTFTGITNFSNTTESTSSTTGATVFAGGIGVAKKIVSGGSITPAANPGMEWGIDFCSGGSTITLAFSQTFDLATGSGMVVIYDYYDGNFNFLFVAGGNATSVISSNGTIVAGAPSADKIGIYYEPSVAKYRIQNNRSTTRTLILSTIKMRPFS